MKKLIILNGLFLAQVARAQTTVEVPPFWQDKTFLLLVGGAVFLIIVLIVKKIINKRNNSANQAEYESS